MKLHFAHTVYLCVPYDSHSKHPLFPCTTLIARLIYGDTRSPRWGRNWNFIV